MAYNEKTILVSGLERKSGIDELFPIVNATAVYIRDRINTDPTDPRKYIGLDETLANIIKRLEDLEYISMSVDSFLGSINGEEGTSDIKVDKGSSISNVVLSWIITPDGKNPTTMTLDGNPIQLDLRSYTDTHTYTSNKTWDLYVNDERNKPDKNYYVSLSFLDRVYWGAKPDPTVSSESYNETFIKSLQSNELSDDQLSSFNADAGYNDYIYYVCPTYFSTPEFHFGEFEVLFLKVASGVTLHNINNVECTYDIYRSVNKNLGDTTYEIII